MLFVMNSLFTIVVGKADRLNVESANRQGPSTTCSRFLVHDSESEMSVFNVINLSS